MKKILTVSLFAMMAVSAANADIASTKYVTDRTGTVSFTADGFAKNASNLTEAINLIDSTLKSTSNTLTEDIAKDINELKGDVAAIEGSAAMTSGITSDKVATYDGYSALITAAKKAGDDAQKTADGAVTVNGQQTTAISANTTAINTLKGEANVEGSVKKSIADAITAANLSQYATTSAMNTELGKKQNNLSADQLTAVNSGITSDKVATYDGYSDKISQNKSAITANTTSINTINNSAVMNSGVTDKVVKSVETHTNDINTIKASDVMKSGVTADIVAKAKSAMQEANLKALESWTTGQCAEPTVTCSLISKGGKIAWEVVTY